MQHQDTPILLLTSGYSGTSWRMGRHIMVDARLHLTAEASSKNPSRGFHETLLPSFILTVIIISLRPPSLTRPAVEPAIQIWGRL
jgi:hypothetical protein